MSQQLPPKENALFKKILRCYEHKQYKNGLKFAKTILTNPKYCEHGETLAMKGLTLNCLGRKDEAYEFVRRGLKNNLKSHVCWHVFGLLQRSDHKYDEAIKCYRNALKWDKDNIQILRDLSLLQVQMRDLEGYRDTRHQLFMLRPTQRVSWIGYAMAYHLLKDYEMAVKILEEFRKTTSAQKPAHVSNANPKSNISNDYEHSELLLYQAQVYQEAEHFQDALDHLNKHAESDICDKLAVQEMKTQLLIKLGRLKEAEKLIRENLIARNQENMYYYKLLEQASHTFAIAKEEGKLKHYMDFTKLYPRAQMPQRIPLSFVSELKTFRTLVDSYLKKSLTKGRPALFRDLKSLYLAECGSPLTLKWYSKQNNLPSKIQVIQDLLLKYHHNLTHYESYEKDEASWGSEDMTTILWVDYFLAQHFDFLNNYELALSYVNEALEHTPTLIELYVVKAKIYKHAGNIEEGVLCMEEAQSLDTADRYLNSKCAKYLLRANRIAESEEMCAKFTREGVSASENLNEMQCMWFQSECALSYQRLEKWGETLKKCVEIDRHFAEITEDQFDFHTYCMRKMTLRAYMGLLRLEDILKSHPFYFVAARLAIEVYLKLYDKPLGAEDNSENVNDSKATPAELKKQLNKQRKLEAKLKATAAANSQQARTTANDKAAADKEGISNELAVEKLIPSKLERPEDALGEAVKFLKPLQLLARERIETHLLAFEIYHRKGKIMLMLQSLKRAVRLDANNSTLRRHQVMFLSFIEARRQQLAAPLQEVVDLELKKMLGEVATSAVELNERFLKENCNSFVHLVENTKSIAMLQESAEAKRNAVNLLCSKDLDGLRDISLDGCVQMINSLKSGVFGKVEETVVEELKKKCLRLFPLASHFLSSSEKLQQKNARQEILSAKEQAAGNHINDISAELAKATIGSE